MRTSIIRIIAITMLITILFQIFIPTIGGTVLAVENAEEQEVEIGREYEIKEEETWDVSENQDGSVIAKWRLEDRTLIISGKGKMKSWNYDDKNIDWHDTQYTNSIEKVIIEKGVTSIGNRAFYECSSLTNIKIPEGVTSIGEYAFYECSSLTNIEIPEGVTSIEDKTFEGCSSLTNIKIPEGVTRIGHSAFEGCSSLTNIKIPEEVTSIASSAFSGCSSLTNITIPEVTSIGSWVFKGCSSLTNINVDVNNKNYLSDNGILFNKEKTEIIYYPGGKKDLQEYIIPEGVTSIEWYAFYECSSLTNIKIPEGVTSIGSSAFEGCSSLTNIKIPEGVTSIGNRAFYECSSLTNIKIPEGVTSIEGNTFSGCSSLTNIEIPEGVTSIGNRAFYECSSLINIKIPEGVTSIGDRAFDGISKLIIYTKADSVLHKYAEEEKIAYILEGKAKEITTKYMIKEEETWDVSENQDGSVIAKWALEDRTLVISGNGEMKSWRYNDEYIDWHDSQYTNSIEKVIIEKGVTSIGRYAFRGCSSLTNIKIPEGVTSIGSSAFKGCSSLTNIEIPEGVTSIGYQSFYGCRSLTNIEIPEGVTSIGDSAFSGCSSLTNIKIPEGVTSIGSSAFLGCSSLTNINVDIDNKKYLSDNGILFNKEKTEIVCYPGGKKDLQQYIIPEGVTSIGWNAFYGCSSLTNIEIPEGVTSIGRDAFLECSSLTNIIIPEGVMSIEDSAFEGCSSLTNIKIPEGVTSIEWNTFSGCSSLTNIEIPEGVTSIGGYAFEGCSSLTNIKIPEGVTSIGGYAFEGCSSLTNIEIPEGVTGIEDRAFKGCSSLTNIEIPEGVTSIEDCAFERCSSLTNIKIPEGVTSIGNSAFYGCSSLTNIIIPEGVTSIGGEAFKGVKNIIIKKNTEGHRYVEEEKVGYIIDEEGPEITYMLNGEIIPKKQHQVQVNVKDKKSGVKEDSLKYQWTQSTEKPSKESFKESLSNGQTIKKDSVDGIWYLWVYAKDKVGNETIKRSEGYNFDNTTPKVEIKYSTTNPTRENVTVTITSNEEIQEVEGWKISENKKELTKEYANNTDETVIIKDKVGNQTEAKISIKNIDRTTPKVEIKYSTTNPTRENVTVTITANEEIQEVEGWKISENKKELTKEYTENTEENVTIKDKAGNETKIKINIKNIDHTLPEIQIGDINGDKKIDITDLLLLKRHIIAGNKEDWKLTGERLQAGDMNEDEQVNITDMLLLKRRIIENL